MSGWELLDFTLESHFLLFAAVGGWREEGGGRERRREEEEEGGGGGGRREEEGNRGRAIISMYKAVSGRTLHLHILTKYISIQGELPLPVPIKNLTLK